MTGSAIPMLERCMRAKGYPRLPYDDPELLELLRRERLIDEAPESAGAGEVLLPPERPDRGTFYPLDAEQPDWYPPEMWI